MEDEAQVRERFGVHPDELCINSIWGGGVGGVAVVDGVSKKCKCWLFKLGLAIANIDGSVLSVEVPDVMRVVMKEQTLFVKGTFSAEPERKVKITIEYQPQRMEQGQGDGGAAAPTSAQTITLIIPEKLGKRFGKALFFIWKHYRGRLSRREAVFLQCSNFIDVVSAISLLPLEFSCNMTFRGQTTYGTLRLNPSESDIHVIFVANTTGVKLDQSLDMLLMLRKVRTLMRTEIWVLIKGEDSLYVFTDLDSGQSEDPERDLHIVWCVNCNALVTLSLTQNCAEPLNYTDQDAGGWLDTVHDGLATPRTGEDADSLDIQPCSGCHSVSDVLQLLDIFQAIDNDNNGFISEDEFVTSLGPAFHIEVTKAVFRVFDVNSDGKISFPEYLFGCRVLRLGSRDDRLIYQHRIFDVQGTGYITLKDFTYTMKLLASISEAVKLPEGCSIEEYCKDLFRSIDENGDDQVSVQEFRTAMLTNDTFKAAIDWSPPESGDDSSGNQIVFGDSQWLMVTCILSGIQQCMAYRERARGKETKDLPKSYFEKKKVWVLGKTIKEAYHPPKTTSLPNGAVATPANSVVYFTDHCPEVFDRIQRVSGVSPRSYKESLGIMQLQVAMLSGAMTSLHQMASSGRSGSFFFRSHDTRYIIKTLDATDAATFRKNLHAYSTYLCDNPDSLLTRFYGLHELQYGDQKMEFVVMQNVCLPTSKRPIHVMYDLKGSSVHRFTPLEKRVKGLALKDLDLTRDLYLNPASHRKFMEQLKSDAKYLEKCNIIDYSLLLGIHKSHLPIPGEVDPKDPLRGFHGGFPSCNRREIYYAGIIDITTDYNVMKKVEHYAKSVRYLRNPEGVSCVGPQKYRERFVRFMESRFLQATNRSPVLYSSRRSYSSFPNGGAYPSEYDLSGGGKTNRTAYTPSLSPAHSFARGSPSWVP
eukprot:TRINITY_DN23386_c0_g1_i1.p1 TRINITY_DN23386_c0_g1~~TRINITY_DN23386_c0_g1_i1.p1  ORF type:complete len:923 (+),score=80.70 TRINITY_DN23386_c0_g1_i1:114-2882(+)